MASPPSSAAVEFDADLLARYDVTGPRYTSYPTAPSLRDDFGQRDYRRAARESNDDPIPRPLSLYVHVPFCESPCFYCGCTRLVTGKGPDDFLTADGIKRSAEEFNRGAAVARRHGLTVSIHNHWWEFLKVDGQCGYEILLEHLNPDVLLEVDTYWAQTAGADPL